jgi:hypothetical protein
MRKLAKEQKLLVEDSPVHRALLTGGPVIQSIGGTAVVTSVTFEELES